jgi:hypothetical protein
MEDVPHLVIKEPNHFNLAATNSIRTEVLRGKAIKVTRTGAARESKCPCKKFSKYCLWNFNLA